MTDKKSQLETGDEGFTMLMVVGVMFAVSLLFLAILASVINESRHSAFQRDSGSAEMAATSGLTAATARISTAVKTVGSVKQGDFSTLPCGQLNGTVPGSSANARYTVVVDYFSGNPNNKPASWRSTNKLSCAAGGATRLTGARYVVLTSTGVAGPAGNESTRVAESITELPTFDTLKLGGQVHPDGEPTMCMTSPDLSAGIPSNAHVTIQPCSLALVKQQTWHWDKKNRFALPAYDVAGGYCLQTRYGPLGGAHEDYWHQNPVRIPEQVIAACSDTDMLQRYHTNSSSVWYVTNAAGTDSDSKVCLTARADTTPRQVVGWACPSYADSWYVGGWGFGGNQPERKHLVGSKDSGLGGMDRATQFANRGSLNTCLDVEGRKVSSNTLIVYPCHVSIKNNHALNQTFEQRPNGQLASGFDNVESPEPDFGPWCVTAPTTVGGNVFVERCGNRADHRDKWTVYQFHEDPKKSFAIVNRGTGMCLTGSKRLPGGEIYQSVSYGESHPIVVVESCNGSDEQRWNFEYTPKKGGDLNFREVN